MTTSRRWCFAAALSASFVASLALAVPGVVKTRDGGTFEGEISEANLMVIVRDKRGIETRIPREQVLTIETRLDPELEFNARYKKLAEGDVEARVELAQYSLSQKRPDLARKVLLEALSIDPNHRVGAALYDVALSQIELDRRAQTAAAGRPFAQQPPASPPATPPRATPANPPAAPAPATGAAAPVSPYSVTRAERPQVSPEQVNAIRQGEIRQGETGVNFRFENDVERRFAQARGMTVASLRSLSPLERFSRIRESGDLTALADVRVLRDPASLTEFRTKVQPRILAGCASAGCHGGDTAGTFFLHNPASTEAATYTNFYVLATSRYPVTLADGKRQVMRMIDRTTPELSLILQFTLPGELARFPHPPVPGFRPLFRTADNDGFRNLQSWIQSTLSPIEPNYGFQFNITPIPTSQPAPATPR
jgi:hypothetical protein